MKKRTEYHIIKDLTAVRSGIVEVEILLECGFPHHRIPRATSRYGQAGIRLKKMLVFLQLRQSVLSMELYHVLNAQNSFLDVYDV